MTQTELFSTDFPVIDYTPATPEPYTVGSILYASWGYEQTNVNFYLVVARKGDWVTLQPMTADKTHTGHMTGTAVPGEVVELACSFRRRLRIDAATGTCYGCNGPESFMGLCLWDGRPKSFTSYA